MGNDEGRSTRFGLRRPKSVGRADKQLNELVAARDQMEQLLAVAIEIGSDLELDPTLHRIISAAMGMTGARYGAVGVWAPDGTLASFVHAGMNPETLRRVGRLPVG